MQVISDSQREYNGNEISNSESSTHSVLVIYALNVGDRYPLNQRSFVFVARPRVHISVCCGSPHYFSLRRSLQRSMDGNCSAIPQKLPVLRKEKAI